MRFYKEFIYSLEGSDDIMNSMKDVSRNIRIFPATLYTTVQVIGSIRTAKPKLSIMDKHLLPGVVFLTVDNSVVV